jgi:hypothetical protein
MFSPLYLAHTLLGDYISPSSLQKTYYYEKLIPIVNVPFVTITILSPSGNFASRCRHIYKERVRFWPGFLIGGEVRVLLQFEATLLRPPRIEAFDN